MRRFFKWLTIATLISGIGLGFYILIEPNQGLAIDDYKNRAAFFGASAYRWVKNVFISDKQALPMKNKEIIWCANECFWLDKDGRAFDLALKTEGKLVPLVIELSDRKLNLKSEIIDKKQVGYLLEIVEFLRLAKINFSRLEVNDLLGEDVQANTSRGPIIYFSLRFSPMFGLGVVKSFKDYGEWEKIEYIDFRAENKVFYKFKTQ